MSDHLGELPLVDRLHHELVAAQTTVAAQIAALVQAATSVREFLSTTTGRVLGRLTRIRADLLGPDAAADDLDIVLVDLAALAGLSLESTVRGPAWRFLDLGRTARTHADVVRFARGRRSASPQTRCRSSRWPNRCCRRTRAWSPTAAGIAATSS